MVLLLTLSVLSIGTVKATTNPSTTRLFDFVTIAVPNVTSAVGWSYNESTEATSDTPYSTITETQTIGADTNATYTAGKILSPLNNTYLNDNIFYDLDNESYSGNRRIEIVLTFNLTKHDIMSETWLNTMNLTVRANCSSIVNGSAILCLENNDTVAWDQVGASDLLNVTTETLNTFNYTQAQAAPYIDNTTKCVAVKFLWANLTDTGGFNATIDECTLRVEYSYNMTLNPWTSTNTETTKYSQTVYNNTDQFTLTMPGTEHSFGIIAYTDNGELIKQLADTPIVRVDGTVVSSSSPPEYNNTITLFEVDNIGSATVAITNLLPLIYFVTPSLSEPYISSASFQGGVNRLTFQVSGTGSATIQLFITSQPYSVYEDQSTSLSTTWANNILSIPLTLSTHTIDIYQFGGIAPPTVTGTTGTGTAQAAAPSGTTPPASYTMVLIGFAIAAIFGISVLVLSARKRH